MDLGVRSRCALGLQRGEQLLVLRVRGVPVGIVVRVRLRKRSARELVQQPAVRVEHRCVRLVSHMHSGGWARSLLLPRVLTRWRLRGYWQPLDPLDSRITRLIVLLAVLHIWWSVSRPARMPVQVTIAEVRLRAPVVLGASLALARRPGLWSVQEIGPVAGCSRPMPEAVGARIVCRLRVGPGTVRGAVIVVSIKLWLLAMAAKLLVDKIVAMEFIRHFLGGVVQAEAGRLVHRLHASVLRWNRVAMHGLTVLHGHL